MPLCFLFIKQLSTTSSCFTKAIHRITYGFPGEKKKPLGCKGPARQYYNQKPNEDVMPCLNHWPALLEAWLALTSIKYHGNL